jgi:arylsulfatase A-like enzyme
MNDRDDEGGWELFNIAADPGETVDLSKEKPEKLQELLDHWSEYVTDYGVVWGPNAMAPGLSESEAPHLHESDMELQRSWLQTPSGQRPSI